MKQNAQKHILKYVKCLWDEMIHKNKGVKILKAKTKCEKNIKRKKS